MWVQNKSKEKIGASVYLKSLSGNTQTPVSYFRDIFMDGESKSIGHLVKIDPSQPFGEIEVKVETKIKKNVPMAAASVGTFMISY